MQRLEVSGAVRPLKWPLGVKWLKTPGGKMLNSLLPLKTLHYYQLYLKICAALQTGRSEFLFTEVLGGFFFY
jgi:hypothetical protein